MSMERPTARSSCERDYQFWSRLASKLRSSSRYHLRPSSALEPSVSEVD